MTNEDIRKPQELKDVAAGQVPHPVSASTSDPDQPGVTPNVNVEQQTSNDLSGAVGGNIAHPMSTTTPGTGQQGSSVTPDSGDGLVSGDDLAGAVGGNIAHPMSTSSPSDQSSDPSQTPGPGQSLEIETLAGAAAGAATNVDSGDGGKPPSADPDPGFDPPPQSIGGGTDITQGGSNAGQTGLTDKTHQSVSD